MMTTGRKRGIIFTVIGALACVLCFLVCCSLAGKTSDETDHVETLQLEMQVGEKYDLGQYLSEAKGEVQLYKLYGSSNDKTSECFSLDAQGHLYAMQAGIYDLSLRVTTESLFTRHVMKQVLRINVLVHDYDFSDYKPVYIYSDLQGSPSGKYILARDMVCFGRTQSEIKDFSGILVNPNGYKITVMDNLPLLNRVSQYSVICGLKVGTGKDGFVWTRSSEAASTGSRGGMIACSLSSSVICDCSIEADIYGDPWLNGFVGSNSGVILRCEFRGTRFNLADGSNLNRAFAIAESGEIRDCTVYADGYREDERITCDRVSLFHALPPTEEDLNEKDAEDLINGNRVFDLSGEHEIDFTKPVRQSTQYSGGHIEDQFKLFKGCVAEFPYGMKQLFETEHVELFSYTNDFDDVFGPDETYFLPYRDFASITIVGRYTHTYFDTSYPRIYAAEEVVELPQGFMVNQTVVFGEFSPSKVTLKFNADTQTEGDLLFLSGYRYGNYSDKIQVEVDFGDSQVYEQRKDGVYRKDDGTLCRYDGEIADGKVTIPDGVTSMSGDVFGSRVVTDLDTNDLQSLSVASESTWQKNLTTLRFGSAMRLDRLGMNMLGRFVSLKSVETDARTDSWYAEDGILYSADGVCAYVPCAYAEGETLTLGDRIINSYALLNNLATTIIFENVEQIASQALRDAQCCEVVVRGNETLTVSSNAFYGCNNLTSFQAEGKVALQASAFINCSALKTLELNENFVSVAYDAVRSCEKFVGYTQAEGCELYNISDGVLFVDGNARLPAMWQKKNQRLTIPDDVSSVLLEAENVEKTECRFSIILIGANVQEFFAPQIRVSAYEVKKENTFFKVEDNVLLTADGTKLVAYPSRRPYLEYFVPESVTEISDYAFAYAEFLEKLDMGPNTERIGIYSFAETKIDDLTFSPKLNNIGEYAFYGANLSTVKLPDSVQTIGDYAFQDASISGQIKLPAGLTEIGRRVFYGCRLDAIDIPEGVERIGDEAFSSSQLKEVSLPESLKEIGDRAFAYTSLKSVELGTNVETVGDWAFYGCAELVSVWLGPNLRTVGENAFSLCKLLSEVRAENADTVYGDMCFEGTVFLADGKTAENGGLCLGNTMLGLFGESENVEVRYGIKEIKSLKSIKVKSLKLPATLSYVPSIEDLPYLEQLWLGLAPQGEEAATYDVGNVKFKAKSDHLYICLPKKVTFSGTIGEDVYLCYNGTPEEFAVYARLDNINDFYSRIYYYSESTYLSNTWYYDANGNMVLRAEAYPDGFTYLFSYDENGLECSVIDYDRAYGSYIEIPSHTPYGNKVTVLEGLGDQMLNRVTVSGMEVRFSGKYQFSAVRMYIDEDCRLSYATVNAHLDIEYLFIDTTAVPLYDSGVKNIVLGKNVSMIDIHSSIRLYYEGTKEEWDANVNVSREPYAFYDEDGVYPDDGSRYWHFDASGLPVLWA